VALPHDDGRTATSVFVGISNGLNHFVYISGASRLLEVTCG